MEFNSKKLSTKYGEIDYCYFENAESYPSGLLVFMGSYVFKEHRRQGRYKEMVQTMMEIFPQGTTVQVPVENKILVPMFERMGFEKVVSIEYWGQPTNCKLMQGKI